MFLKSFVIIVILLYPLAAHKKYGKDINKSGIDCPSEIKNMVNFLSESFYKFKIKRRQIKKAFNRFVKEVFFDKNPCSLKFP